MITQPNKCLKERDNKRSYDSKMGFKLFHVLGRILEITALVLGKNGGI